MLRHPGRALAFVLAMGTLGPAAGAQAVPGIDAVAGTIAPSNIGNGGFNGDGIAATLAKLYYPTDVAATAGGGFLIADKLNHRVRRVLPDGTIITAAGTGTPGYGGDTGAATAAQLNAPAGVAASPDGGFLIADTGNHRIRRVWADGTITTVAGTGTSGYSADGVGATTSELAAPTDVVVAAGGALLIADTSNSRIRRVAPGADGVVDGDSDDLISTVAGTATAGYNGDGGAATTAQLDDPRGVAAAADGAVLIADADNHRIRRVTPDVDGLVNGTAGDVITTVAGSGAEGGLGDGGAATVAQLFRPRDVAPAPDGALLISDPALNRVRRVAAGADGVVDGDADELLTTVAGTGGGSGMGPGAGDGGPATAATITGPNGLSILADGSFLVVSEFDHQVRAVEETPPVAFDLVAPGDLALGLPARPGLSWNAAVDTLTGIDRYELWLDGVRNRDVGVGACSAGVCASQPQAALGDGVHSWRTRAFDGAGNVRDSATRSFTVAEPPVAALAVNPAVALTGQAVAFDASGSTDNSGIARYEWDLDGDGGFETDTGPTPAAARAYAQRTETTVRLRITDGAGLTGLASAAVAVALAPPGGPVGITVSDRVSGDTIFTNDKDVTITVTWPAFAFDLLVSNDGGFRGAQTLPVATSSNWQLVPAADERLPKTVYVRFIGPGLDATKTFTDDIILDTTPPQVTQAATAGGAGAATAIISARRRRATSLRVSARDNASGIAAMQLANNRRKPGREAKFKRTLRIRNGKIRFAGRTVSARRRLYVRVHDGAGNASRWRSVKGTG